MILGLHCAGQGCGIALWHQERLIAQRAMPMARGQDAALFALLDALLEDTATTITAITRIAVTRGPGSFTGLRVGLAAARGLGLGLGCPVLGIDRLRLYRHELAADLVVLDSRRDELFCAFGEAPPFLATAQTLWERFGEQPLKLAGDAGHHLASAGPWRATFLDFPDGEAAAVARFAATLDPADPAWPAVPLYLRAPDVSCGPRAATEEP